MSFKSKISPPVSSTPEMDRVVQAIYDDLNDVVENGIGSFDPKRTSFISLNPGGRATVADFILKIQDGLALFADNSGIGSFATDYLATQGPQIEVSLNLRNSVKTGMHLYVLNFKETATTKFVVGKDGSTDLFGPGENVTVPVKPQRFNVRAGDTVLVDPSYVASEINVSPSEIRQAVNKKTGLDAIGTVNLDYNMSTLYDTIALKDIDINPPVRLKDGQKMVIEDDDGNYETITIRDDQVIGTTPYNLKIQQWNPNRVYEAGHAYVREPAYSTGTRIVLNENEIEAVASTAGNNSSSISSLQIQVGDFDTDDFTGFSNDIGDIGGRSALFARTDAEGNTYFAGLELLSGTEGATANLAANYLNMSGQASFYQALQDNGFPKVDAINITMTFSGDKNFPEKPTNFPAKRPDTTDLVAGDLIMDTANGNVIYRYTGSGWARAVTVVDGGEVTTGKIVADRIDIDDLYSKEAVITGSLKSNADALAPTGGVDGYILNASGFYAGKSGQTTADANVRITNDGKAYFKEILEAKVGPANGSQVILNKEDIELRPVAGSGAAGEIRFYDDTGYERSRLLSEGITTRLDSYEEFAILNCYKASSGLSGATVSATYDGNVNLDGSRVVRIGLTGTSHSSYSYQGWLAGDLRWDATKYAASDLISGAGGAPPAQPETYLAVYTDHNTVLAIPAYKLA